MQTPLIQNVAVIGLGRMGHGIAQMFAAAGCTVRCHGYTQQHRESLHHRVESNLRLAARAGLGRLDEIDQILGRLEVFDDECQAMQGAQFVTEAVREDLACKQAFFKRAEQVVSSQTILASNTSSLPIGPMTSHLQHQERVVVTHWFNPPHLVPVVEVVPGEKTSEQTMATSCDLMQRIGKLPVRLSRDIPGFLVNRIQTAMFREVWSLLGQGIASAEDIDVAVRGSMGFRLAACGPLLINDFGGLNIWKQVYENLAPQIESSVQLPQLIRDRVARGHTGIEAGRGMHDYTPRSAQQRTLERDQRFLALAKLFYSDQAHDQDAEA